MDGWLGGLPLFWKQSGFLVTTSSSHSSNITIRPANLKAVPPGQYVVGVHLTKLMQVDRNRSESLG